MAAFNYDTRWSPSDTQAAFNNAYGAQQQQQMQSLSQAALSGDVNAFNQLAAIDPQRAAQLKQLTQGQQVKIPTASEMVDIGKSLKMIATTSPQNIPIALQRVVEQYPDLAPAAQEFAGAFSQNPQAGISMLDEFINAGAEIDKPKSRDLTAQEKNFERLQSLRAQGKDTEAAEFAKLINITDEKKLSSASEKVLLTSTDKYFDLQNTAGEAYSLAQALDSTPFEGGKAGTIGEWFRNVTGSQTAADELRRKFRAIKGSLVVKNLPPGAASDTDIKLALSGFPDDNWGSEKLSSYVRGLAKVAEVESDFHRARAEYIGENNGAEGFIKEWKKYAQEKYGKDNPMFKGNQSDLDQQRSLADGNTVVNWADL